MGKNLEYAQVNKGVPMIPVNAKAGDIINSGDSFNGQLGTNWREIVVSCATCKTNFVTYEVGEEKPGKYSYYIRPEKICRKCQKEKEQAERQAKRLKMLGELTMEVTEEWERVCRIPYKFYDTTFEDWDQIRFPAAFKNIKSQCESLLTDSPDLGSRLLMGTVGTGKTRLICTSAEYIMAKSEKARVDQNLYVRKNKCPVFYISEVEMFKFLYASIRNNKRYDEDEERTQRYIDDPDDFEYGDVESKLISRMGNIDFLLIDDIGKVKPRDLSYVQRIYYTVIDHRYTEEGKPVFLSTNLGKDALIEYLGKATYSRLVEMCGKGNIIVMAGDDYREILASKSEVKKVK